MTTAPLSADVLDAVLKIATEAAQIAADLMNDCFEKRQDGVPVADTKSSGADLVTEYDRRCEELVLAHVMKYNPDWNVVSEESNSDAPLTDTPTWIVDPIDGTTSFVHGSFDCCVSVGLAVNKKPVVGVVNIPRLNEVFWAVEGRGAFCNGKPIHVSTVNTLNKAVVCTHCPYCRHPEVIEALTKMNTTLMLGGVHAVRSYGSAAMDICSVACGRLDLYYEVGPHSWDMCAGAIIVREAGGVIHNVDNGDDSTNLDMKSRGYACGSCTALTAVAVKLTNETNYRNLILTHEKK